MNFYTISLGRRLPCLLGVSSSLLTKFQETRSHMYIVTDFFISNFSFMVEGNKQVTSLRRQLNRILLLAEAHWLSSYRTMEPRIRTKGLDLRDWTHPMGPPSFFLINPLHQNPYCTPRSSFGDYFLCSHDIKFWCKGRKRPGRKRPFYILHFYITLQKAILLSCQAFDLDRGWSWPCCDRDEYLVIIVTK